MVVYKPNFTQKNVEISSDKIISLVDKGWEERTDLSKLDPWVVNGLAIYLKPNPSKYTSLSNLNWQLCAIRWSFLFFRKIFWPSISMPQIGWLTKQWPMELIFTRHPIHKWDHWAPPTYYVQFIFQNPPFVFYFMVKSHHTSLTDCELNKVVSIYMWNAQVGTNLTESH